MPRFFFYFVVCLFALSAGITSAEFAGSKSCKNCHKEIFSTYIKSGHPHKLIKVTDNRPPSYPANTSPGVLRPPEGYEWKDISYVIGGFGWKARFLDQQGYILTGADRQYNLSSLTHNKDAHWVAYDGQDHALKPYNCGACHATGWVATGAGGPHQDGLVGIQGTWEEPGVTCEACHGPSAKHVAEPVTIKPLITENCESCHVRGSPTEIDASEGLIRHHEQYEDMLASPHKEFACSSCHDPHKSTKYSAGGYKGDVNTCMSCHRNIEIKLQSKKNMNCNSCHMPFAVKSAIAANVLHKDGAVPKGDLRTHIQRITLKPEWNMFTDDGKFVRVNDQGKAYLTLDYVCLSCHTSNDMSWARTHAKRIHH